MPSVDVAATVDALVDTATNTPFPKLTEVQLVATGSVLAVQVMPSTDVAAALDVTVLTATKTPFP